MMKIGNIDAIVYAYNKGINHERVATLDLLDKYKQDIETLKREREMLISRVDELTTKQFETMKALFDKVSPGHGLTDENITDEIRKYCL